MSAHSEIPTEQLLMELCLRLGADFSKISASTSTSTSIKVEKVKVKRIGGPTAWSDWTKKMLAENKEEVTAFTASAEKKVGAHLQWIKINKGKESPEWIAFQAEWKVAHPKKEDESDGGSVPSEKSSRRGPKKLEEMTTEERSAHDAAIAARRAKKEAEKASGEAAGRAESAAAPVAPMAPVSSSSSVASEKKKSSYVKVADMTPEQLAKKVATAAAAKAKKAAKDAPKAVTPKAATPKAVTPKAATPKAEEDEDEDEDEEVELESLPYVYLGQPHFRLGSKNSDGSIAWGGHMWQNKGGSRGLYVGCFNGDILDTDAEEPLIE